MNQPCRCPHCRAGFTIPDDMSAKEARCPRCRSALRLSSARGKTTVVLLESGDFPSGQTTALYQENGDSPTQVVVSASTRTGQETAKRKKAWPWLWMLAGVGCLAALLCGGAGTVFVILAIRPTVRQAAPEENAAMTERPADIEQPDNQKDEMTFAAYMASRPIKPVKLRLRASLSSDYLLSFRHFAGSHYSIYLADPKKPVPSAHGYIRKDSPDGKRVFESLKDGETHLLRLEISSDGPVGGHMTAAHGDIVTICRLADEP